jgi:putative membrane protein
MLTLSTVANVLVALVAALHLFFLVLEMFLWTTPYGRRVFGLSESSARETAKLAANQGLYNGFLAAGLVWGLWLQDEAICLFFLACVTVAGLFGAWTVKRSIMFVQALPAVAAAAAVHYL